ncbi:MAG TPA: zinc ribbon domain-containing protein [Terriglobia bacterium]|nr:zinc ribbon domain-containing protein [Terriglobia bacterium]
MRKRFQSSGLRVVSFPLFLLIAIGISSTPQARILELASPPTKLMFEGKQLGVRVSQKPGDVCLIDGKKLRPTDPVYLIVNGFRIPLHWPDCYDRFIHSPRKWLSHLEPGGGAFLGAEAGSGGPSLIWIWLGIYVLAGLAFAAICAQRSLEVGYAPAAGFALGFFLNLPGYLFLVSRPRRKVQAPGGIPAGLRKIPATHSPQACPRCGMPNHPSAQACIACGVKLLPRFASEVSKIHSSSKSAED